MLTYITGFLDYIGKDFVIVEVMGLGLKVVVPLSTLKELSSIGDKVKLYTHLQIKEDGFQIYGFKSKNEQEIFEKLVSISGIGPKAAISILSTLSVDKFIKAVNINDYTAIEESPGIGKKTAQRIVLELKDKLNSINIENDSIEINDDALNALISLGYSKQESISALKGIDCDNLEDIIKQALKKLMK